MAWNLLRSEGNVWSTNDSIGSNPAMYVRVEYEINGTGTAYRMRVTLFMRRNSGYSGRYWFHYNVLYSTNAVTGVEVKPGGSESTLYAPYSWWTSNYGRDSYNDPIQFITDWIGCTPGATLIPYLRLYSGQSSSLNWTMPGNSYPIYVPNPYTPPTAPTIYVDGVSSITVDSRNTNFGLTASGGSESQGGGTNTIRMWFNDGVGWRAIGNGATRTSNLNAINSAYGRGQVVQFAASRFDETGNESALGNVVTVTYRIVSIQLEQVANQPADAIRFNYTSNVTITGIEYSVGGGGWITASGKPIDILGLEADTTYPVSIRVTVIDGQQYTFNHNWKTSDIARFISYTEERPIEQGPEFEINYNYNPHAFTYIEYWYQDRLILTILTDTVIFDTDALARFYFIAGVNNEIPVTVKLYTTGRDGRILGFDERNITLTLDELAWVPVNTLQDVPTTLVNGKQRIMIWVRRTWIKF